MENQFLFRRQFILSSFPGYQFDDWKNSRIGENGYLSVHPDLEVASAGSKKSSLTLLGFAIDPFSPEKSNQQIVEDMVAGNPTFDEIIRKTEPFGGRWLFIYQNGNDLKIFSDPCGNRPVYYLKTNDDTFLCGPNPAIMQHFHPIKENITPEIQQVLDHPMFKIKEQAWIGNETIYKDVYHLMANFYLDVNTKEVKRFWPYAPMGHLTLKEATGLSAKILKGSLDGIGRRHKLSVAVTAGWDSRVIMAASKDVKENVTYFVSLKGTEPDNFHEKVVPVELFEKMKMPFYVQTCNVEVNPEFKKTIETNVSMARTYLQKTKNIYKYHLDFDGMINVNGNASEIGRVCVRPIFPEKASGKAFLKKNYISYGGEYYKKQLDQWVEEVRPYCLANGLNIWDMFYWEQRMGNWGSVYPSEQDIAIDQFSPFNNRLLITTMLSLDEKYRKYPDYKLHYEIIRALWPETLQVPVGIQPPKAHLKIFLKHAISDVLYTLFFFRKLT